jgi:hypothetical protein
VTEAARGLLPRAAFFAKKGGAQPPSAGLFQEQLAGMAGMSRQKGIGQAAPDVDSKAS